MGTLHRLRTEDNQARAERAPMLGLMLLRIDANGAIVVYPLLDPHYAALCYSRLQALACAWVNDPERLADICELDPPTRHDAMGLGG